MKRSRFLGLAFTILSVVTVAAAQNGCSSSNGAPDGARDDAGPSVDGGGPSSTEIPSFHDEVQTLGKWCESEAKRLGDGGTGDAEAPGEFDHQLTGEGLQAAQAAIKAGESDIPISPSKCSRIFVKREGGRVVAEAFVQAPFTTREDPETRATVYVPQSISRWRFDTDGERFVGDYDGDGRDEAELRTVYGKESIYEERSASGEVALRNTALVIPGGNAIDIKDEALEDGSLRVVRTVRVPGHQEKCDPAPKRLPPDPTAPYRGPARECTEAEVRKIVPNLIVAVQKGANCLKAMGNGAEADVITALFVNDKVLVHCTDETALLGLNDLGFRWLNPESGRIILSTHLFTRDNPVQISTLAHEIFHFFDVHDPDFQDMDGADKRRVDRVNACEQVCFGKTPNMCDLARCQQKTVSTSWRGKFCEGTVTTKTKEIEAARGDGVKIGACYSGHQVGALCRSMKFMGEDSVQFCSTLSECNADCEKPCESLSLSCNNDCR